MSSKQKKELSVEELVKEQVEQIKDYSSKSNARNKLNGTLSKKKNKISSLTSKKSDLEDELNLLKAAKREIPFLPGIDIQRLYGINSNTSSINSFEITKDALIIDGDASGPDGASSTKKDGKYYIRPRYNSDKRAKALAKYVGIKVTCPSFFHDIDDITFTDQCIFITFEREYGSPLAKKYFSMDHREKRDYIQFHLQSENPGLSEVVYTITVGNKNLMWHAKKAKAPESLYKNSWYKKNVQPLLDAVTDKKSQGESMKKVVEMLKKRDGELSVINASLATLNREKALLESGIRECNSVLELPLSRFVGTEITFDKNSHCTSFWFTVKGVLLDKKSTISVKNGRQQVREKHLHVYPSFKEEEVKSNDLYKFSDLMYYAPEGVVITKIVFKSNEIQLKMKTKKSQIADYTFDRGGELDYFKFASSYTSGDYAITINKKKKEK